MGPFIIILLVVGGIVLFKMLPGSGNTSPLNRIRSTFGKKPSYTEYEMHSIESYWYYAKEYIKPAQMIDKITWNDLDMDEVYKRINVCNTSVGEEYLYHLLHEVDFDSARHEKREKLIKYFKRNPQMREYIQMALMKLGKNDFNRLASFIFDAKSKQLENTGLYKVLAAMPILSIAIMFLLPPLGIFMLVVSVLANATIYFRLKLKLDSEFMAIKYLSAMLYSCDKVLKEADDELYEMLSDLDKNYQVFKTIKGRYSSSAQSGIANFAFIADYVKMIFASDVLKYNRVMNLISNESEAFNNLYREYGQLDAAISILSFRESVDNYCLPIFNVDNSITFDNLYHPLLDDAVKNSGQISRNSIVTGPNASGKSTFIKALAVNSILAQTINTCCAKSYTLRRSLVMTSMAVRDSLIEGDSYFITEIKSLKRVLDMMGDVPCTCFIDEILRGTNTIERISASASILEHLMDKDCLCMVASHDIELTKIMEQTYDNYHFSEDVGSEGVSFDFRLKDGAAHTKNAIRLLDYLGYDKNVVNKANAMVKAYSDSGSWGV